jgi:hypothetical protein
MDATDADDDSRHARAAIETRANLLLEGDTVAVDAMMRLLLPHLRPPLVHWHAGTRWSAPATDVGTMVLCDLAGMAREDQPELFSWIDGPGRGAHVVTTASMPLYSLVERGEFLEVLYYRVNTMLIRCARPNQLPAPRPPGQVLPR